MPPTQLVLMRAAIAKKVEARVAPSDGGLRDGDRDQFDDHHEHDDDATTAEDHDEDEGPPDGDEGEKPR